jgi:hypothetical protein
MIHTEVPKRKRDCDRSNINVYPTKEWLGLVLEVAIKAEHEASRRAQVLRHRINFGVGRGSLSETPSE